MKWIAIALAVLAALVGIVLLIGSALPQGHVATVRARLNQPPGAVYAKLADVRGAVAWREDLQRVEVLSGPGEPLQWRETGRFGTITFIRDEEVPDRKLVGRIADPSEGFGGRWIFEIGPAGPGGTLLTVTEAGEVYNPLFRFMSRFVFGHYASLESYVRALGRSFDEEPSVERVPS